MTVNLHIRSASLTGTLHKSPTIQPIAGLLPHNCCLHDINPSTHSALHHTCSKTVQHGTQ
jgi:hypothetical protein